MNSLRARLILGFSLVAILPLALAMILLEQRIQHTVRAQAAARLDAAIAVLRHQLADDGARLEARLQLLARDAQLKRLQLAGPEAELEMRQYLEDQRFLLQLDYLAVTDSAGRLAADASLAARPGERPLAATSLPPAPDHGGGIVPLAERGGLALDARAPITYADLPVGAVRGGLRLDSLFLARLQRMTGLDLVLRDGSGHVTATTLHGALAPEPRPADTTVGRVRLEGHAYFTREAPLVAGPPLRSPGSTALDHAADTPPPRARGPWTPAPSAVGGPRLTALASAAASDDAITVLRFTALALGGLGVLVAIVLGLVWSHQVSRPVVRLAGFSERISRGEWDEPLALESMRELNTLVEALERMRRDLGGYRDRLRASERQAAYGQMARRVAHEIKNPLTPIALSVAGLQRAYAQQRPDFPDTLAEAARTVSEEVHRLKQLLHEFGELGRFPPPRPVVFDLRDLLRDLGALHAHDVEAGRLALDLPAVPLHVDADQDQLRRALLNLAQNALDATASPPGQVWVRASSNGDHVQLAIADNGPGLTDEQRANLFVPGFTTKAHGSGLGLTLVERIVTDHGGTLEVESAPGRGTTFVLRLPRTERTPSGD